MGNVTVLQPQKPVDLDGKQLALIRRTVAADTNQEEFDLFIEAARRVGLDPFRKQIYAVVYSKDNAKKRQMSIITGIDGFRAVADRSGNYRPDENEPEIVYRDDLKDPETNPLGIEKATVTVHKRDAKGEWHPIKGWAYWDEFAPLKEIWQNNKPTGKFKLQNDFWRSKPRIMLPKCAEAQALRKGWPEDLSGIYAPEEMEQAAMIDITATEAADAYQEERRMVAVNAADTIAAIWKAGEPMEFVPVGQYADRVSAFLTECEYSAEVHTWFDRNKEGMRHFYAKQPNDCLEVKKALENRATELETKEQAE